MADATEQSSKARLGIVGLDDILLGGLRRNRMFLLEGTPGAQDASLKKRLRQYKKALEAATNKAGDDGKSLRLQRM